MGLGTFEGQLVMESLQESNMKPLYIIIVEKHPNSL